MPCCAAERKNHSVDISVQFMGYLRRVRISGEKGSSQGRQEGMAYKSGSVNVLYCIDGNTVWYCYCLKLGSCGTVLLFYCCFVMIG